MLREVTVVDCLSELDGGLVLFHVQMNADVSQNHERRRVCFCTMKYVLEVVEERIGDRRRAWSIEYDHRHVQFRAVNITAEDFKRVVYRQRDISRSFSFELQKMQTPPWFVRTLVISDSGLGWTICR